MKTFLLSMLGAFVAMILFVAMGFFLLTSMVASASKPTPMPDSMVIAIDLRQELSDTAPSGGLAGFFGARGFTDTLLQLRAMENDDRVKGIFIRASGYGIGSARAEEFRDALKRLQAKGKFVMVHSQGSLLSGPSAYRAISAADEIWLQPGSELSIPGLSMESLFLGGAMDKFGVQPEFVQLYEYKGAVDTFTGTGYSDANREAMQAIANSVWDTSLTDIAADRGRDVDTVRAVLESGPMDFTEAEAAGLVTNLGWPEDAAEAALAKAGIELEQGFTPVFAYRPEPQKSSDTVTIAYVGAEGDVMTGYGQSGPFDSAASFASDRLAGAILAAARDENVKAIVFRIDSGGGDPAAAEQVWRAVERAREMGKPVVVSMGGLAASAAYYVAAPADYIYANDTTITGSIGVFGGKFAIEDAASRIGVSFDTVQAGGDFADAFSAEPFTPEQYEAFHAALVRTYDRFIEVVAKGRGMSENEVRAIARGRVWSGRDAIGIGLVDARGGLIDALEKAKELSGEDMSKAVRVIRFPAPVQGPSAFTGLVGMDAGDIRASGVISSLAQDREVQMLLTELARAQAMREGRVEARIPGFNER